MVKLLMFMLLVRVASESVEECETRLLEDRWLTVVQLIKIECKERERENCLKKCDEKKAFQIMREPCIRKEGDPPARDGGCKCEMGWGGEYCTERVL